MTNKDNLNTICELCSHPDSQAVLSASGRINIKSLTFQSNPDNNVGITHHSLQVSTSIDWQYRGDIYDPKHKDVESIAVHGKWRWKNGYSQAEGELVQESVGGGVLE